MPILHCVLLNDTRKEDEADNEQGMNADSYGQEITYLYHHAPIPSKRRPDYREEKKEGALTMLVLESAWMQAKGLIRICVGRGSAGRLSAGASVPRSAIILLALCINNAPELFL
jgi:hypothetical protein